MIQGVIFDQDGLMFDTESIWALQWEPAFARYGLPKPSQQFIEGARGMSGESINRYIAAHYPQLDADGVRRALWELAAEAFAQGVPIKKGLIELLDWLVQQNIPRIVASSSPRAMVERNLKTSGVAHYFNGLILCGDEVRCSKPDPEMFLKASAKLGLPPQRCLVLEDSYNGIRAGRAAGNVTVMVPDLMPPNDEMRSLYDACCTDLLEVLALLKEGKL